MCKPGNIDSVAPGSQAMRIGLSEVLVILGQKESSRPAWNARDPISKKKNKKPTSLLPAQSIWVCERGM